MHIVMMIIGALTTIGVIIWRIQMAAHAAREIGDMAKTAANLPRRLAFRRKSGQSGSKLVTDPREAAVILMLEVARANGEVSREHKSKISSLIVENFHFTPEEADEVLAQAAWVSASEAGTDGLVRRMTKLVLKAVTHKEVVDLDGMLVEVSETEGLPTPDQMSVLQSFRSMAGVSA